jgi:vacuolar-type H+-ATPase subunit D/Vma8
VFHSNETLDVAIDTTKRLLNSCERLLPPNISDDPPLSDLFHRISTLEKDVQSIKRRSESLTERLQNEINLVSCAFPNLKF